MTEGEGGQVSDDEFEDLMKSLTQQSPATTHDIAGTTWSSAATTVEAGVSGGSTTRKSIGSNSIPSTEDVDFRSEQSLPAIVQATPAESPRKQAGSQESSTPRLPALAPQAAQHTIASNKQKPLPPLQSRGPNGFCTQCGEALVPNGRFCAGCGSQVVSAESLQANLAHSRSAPSGSVSARESRLGRRTPIAAKAAASLSPPRAPRGRRGEKCAPPALSSSAPASARHLADDSQESTSLSPKSKQIAAKISSAQGQQPLASSEQQLQATDPTLMSVAQRLTQALNSYYQKCGVQGNNTALWLQFLQEVVDTDGTGQMTFEEFDIAARNMLRAQVSRYELRVFWRRLDSRNRGLLTMADILRVFYRLEISEWPVLSPSGVLRIIRLLNAAAERHHRFGGNWFKIFASLDMDRGGGFGYDALRRCIRGSFPALQIPERDLPEVDIQGLWNLLDADRCMEVTVQEFMVFMRRQAASSSTHKPAHVSRARRGQEESKKEVSNAPQRSEEELVKMSKALEHGLQLYYHNRGIHANTSSCNGGWNRFLQETDVDDSGRLTFCEYFDIMAKLRKWAPSVSTEDLKALWVHMDSNSAGEVTHHQLSLGLYRLELESWPDASAKQLQHTISEMNAAAKHWHRAPGNWYKLFLLIDTDDSGHIGFDELQSLIRGSFPSLSVSPQHISDEEIKALWKKLDEKRTSNANVQQFMSFMRKWGAEHSMHRLTSYSEKMRGISETMGRDIASEIAAAPALAVADLAAVTSRLAEMLLQWVVARGIGGVTLRSDATSPALWIHLLDHVVIDKSGRLTFSEFEDACKSILKVGKVATDDELKALWRAIDSNGSQEITPKEFGLGCYRIQVESWPSLEVAEIPRYIQILNRAVDKWHMCAGNWYKVFVKCDLNGSGDLDFEEWRNIVRRSFPGLSISSQELSEDSLRGLWRSIDDDLSSRVTVKEFMLFMRQHEKSLQKSGIKQAQAVRKKQSLPSIARSREQLVSLAHHLQAALLAYWAKKGVHSDNRSCSWPQFFKDVGKDRSSRIPFDELEKLMTERMRHPTCTDDEVIKGVTRDDLIALYNVAIAGRTRLKEVAVKDWILCLYRIDIEEWPDYDSKNITRVVDIINEAGQRWHQAGGNWYKVFRRVYPDDSGTMTFEDFRGMCYNPLPCLSISSKCVREADLKALWKGLDQDRSGLTSVNEFMIFMRKHGTVQLHQSPGCKRARGQDTLARSRAEADEIPGIDALSADHCALISRALGKESSETLAAAYSKWGIPWSGFVSEWDLLSVVRELLKISEDQMDDDTIYIIWRHLDSDGVGQVAVEEILQLADMLRCDTSA